MKKFTMIVTTLAIFTLTAIPVFALDLGTSYLTSTGLGTKELRTSIMSIVNVALGFLAVVVIVGIIYGGFMMMTSGGSEDKNASGRKVVVAGVIGLIIILAALAITNFVIVQLLTATGA